MRRDIDCYRALRITHLLFYGGFALALLPLLIVRAWNAFTPPLVVLAVLGGIALVLGLLCCGMYVRCPFCGASLMLGGRIPRELPRHCPSCGREL